MSISNNSNRKSSSSRRRGWALRGILAALIVMALAYLRCGGAGFGLGGGGDGVGVSKRDEPPSTSRPLVSERSDRSPAAAEPVRCQLRLDAAGLWLLGAAGQEQVAVATAVKECKRAGGADVVITGDARQGWWDELRTALDGEGVPSFVRGGGAGAK
jgi:hypothetical protein